MLYKFLFLVNDNAGKLDVEGSKTFISGILDPIVTVALWVIPIIGIIAAIIEVIKYLSQDENERQRDSLFKRLKTIFLAVIIGETIPIIFKLFNIGA